MTAKVPGARNITAPTSDMIVPLATTDPRSAQATLAVLNAYFSGLSNNTSIVALNTVGAGTITAASIIAGVVARGGTQSATAFADTTATAAAIIALMPNATIGQAFEFLYQNNTDSPATIGGGTGVTVSGITVVPAHTTARYLVTYTAANTVTMVGLSKSLPSTTSGTFTNNGTSTVTTADPNVTANSAIVITLKTVGGTVGAIPHLLTITPGTGFATVGTASDTSVYNYLIIN